MHALSTSGSFSFPQTVCRSAGSVTSPIIFIAIRLSSEIGRARNGVAQCPYLCLHGRVQTLSPAMKTGSPRQVEHLYDASLGIAARTRCVVVCADLLACAGKFFLRRGVPKEFIYSVRFRKGA